MIDARTRRRSATLAALLLAPALAMSACGGDSGDAAVPAIYEGTYQPGAPMAEDASGKAAADGMTAGSGIVGGTEVYGPVPGAGPEEGQHVIESGSVSLTVDDPKAAAERIVGIAMVADGRIDSRTEQEGNENSPASAWVTLRVPAAALDSVLAKLREVGEVDNLSVTSSDVTATVVDLDARIRSLSASTARLAQIMTDATTASDVIAAESALSQRQAELESLQSQRASLADQEDLSSVTVSATARVAERDEDADRGGLGEAISRGWRNLVDFLADGAYGVVLALPWIGFGVVIAGALFVAARTLSRRRGAAAAAASPAPASPAEPAAPPAPTRG